MVKEIESEIDWSEPLENVLPDFSKSGPLDVYRKQCSFNWREMASTLDDEEAIRIKNGLWKKMEQDPLFAHSPVDLSLEEHRISTLKKVFRFQEFIPKNINPRLNVEIATALGQYDWSVCLRRGILLGFFPNAVRGLGTEKHRKYINAAEKLQLTGCIAMTEISHGTNTKAFRTRATFDTRKQKFILHTPDFEAAKCWSANLGKTANYAYILAQLYTPDGECHGLHGFVVPIRDKQMNPLPGVTIGDMGAKIGLNGLDNGFMMFDNYELDIEGLLDKTGTVTPEGTYISPIKDTKKRFSASLGVLSGPRFGIVGLVVANASIAISIAIRYSAVRRQFGPDGSPELPVIEYQMQQCRLFPLLAGCYVFKCFSRYLFDTLFEFILSQFNPDISAEERAVMGAELHGISAAAKPVAGWLARDTVQESREACGGHGYLKAAGIGRLRDDGDSFLTFEGDNNVLLQQASNWLLNVWVNTKREEMATSSPFGAIKFLKNADARLKKKFVFKSREPREDFLQPGAILKAYKWLVCYLLKSTSEKFQGIQASGEDNFTAKNDSQFYHARTLSIVFVENYALDVFWHKFANNEDISWNIRLVLKKLMLIYGLSCLERHAGILYAGGYFSGPKPGRYIRENIIQLCKELKAEAISLVDALAPTDFILNSCLGASDGQVYKHLENAMKQTPGCFEKSKDWVDISKSLYSKL
ncbi:peroxisomal acyl-coenzyme A oxidase 3 [Folsomia candida]|uniref:peroxisomal acyl-coenzyme A oxidase 3 n=1 Tax=Folsomia candida TaxID=158441 RepID=UPI000B90959F|nr:peroxisomal acyl-coenzyme A oxidase 3 [Folsomia candida]